MDAATAPAIGMASSRGHRERDDCLQALAVNHAIRFYNIASAAVAGREGRSITVRVDDTWVEVGPVDAV